MIHRYKKMILPFLSVCLVITLFAVFGANSRASDRNIEKSESTYFVLNCETRESEFYNWIERVLWKKTRRFSRNLDGAIDALVSNPDWTIRIVDTPCRTDVMVKSRREALQFMIDDAHSEGAGKILYGM